MKSGTIISAIIVTIGRTSRSTLILSLSNKQEKITQQLGQPDGGEQRYPNQLSGRRWLPLALSL
jgi:hypothetical protein